MKHRRILFALWVALGLVVFPALSQAARVLVVVRGRGAGSDKAAVFIDHYARDYLAKKIGYDVVDPGRVFGASDFEQAQRAFEEAEGLLQQGRVAYDALELDRALDVIQKAVGQYERFAAHLLDYKALSDAFMLLGATYLLRGDEKSGSRKVAQAIAVYPATTPDPRVFNPSMRKIFDAKVEQMRARPSAKISVGSNPSYAEVLIDGKFAGVTPLSVDGLTEGRHYVTFHKTGYRSATRAVELTGDTETAQVVSLTAGEHFSDYDPVVDAAIRRFSATAEGPAEEAARLGALTNADQIFLGEVRLDGERVQLRTRQYDLTGGRLSKSAQVAFSYDNRPASYEREIESFLKQNFVAVGAGQSAVASPTAGLPGGQQMEPAVEALVQHEVKPATSRCFLGISCAKGRAWVIGVGTVGGAAMVVGGMTSWYLARRDNNAYRSAVQVSSNANSLKSRGRFKEYLGYGLMGGGIAFSLVGAVTYLWTLPDTAAPAAASGAAWRVTPVPLADGGGMVQAHWAF